jgi:hypothetical protein
MLEFSFSEFGGLIFFLYHFQSFSKVVDEFFRIAFVSR